MTIDSIFTDADWAMIENKVHDPDWDVGDKWEILQLLEKMLTAHNKESKNDQD